MADIAAVARSGYTELRRRCSDLPDLGGCLLLGKHYAHPASRLVYLGLNPGASPATMLDVAPQPFNLLLEGPNEGHHA